MSVFLYQRPYSTPSVPRATQSSSVDLVQMKLKQGAAVYKATINRTAAKSSPIDAQSLLVDLQSDRQARPKSERPRLQFKHFTQRNVEAQSAPQSKQALSQNRPADHPVRNRSAATPLDLGRLHVLGGNAPAVLGQLAQNASSGKIWKKSNPPRLSERFAAELEEAVGQHPEAGTGVPSFVPKHGRAKYVATGCNCVASFMGFDDSLS